LSRAELDELVERLAQAGSRAERLAMPGMDPDRVDVLLPAALIHQALAHRYRWDSYRLSAGGLRWGLLCGALNAAHPGH
jgi:exopolyphosphatase/pppGpp-phosphohydrolase